MPDSATTLLCGGYTTAGFLGIGAGSIPTKISLTNYSATLRNTLIQSQAMLHQASDVTTVKRTKNAFILGVPTITCDISFEIGFSLLNSLFSVLKSKRNDVLKAKITDKASGIAWDFDECYLQSFSFGVQQDTILSANLSLFVQPNTVSYSYTDRSLIEVGNDTVIPLIQPIPYYSWKVGDIEDIIDFSFSYSQQVTPKYECAGDDQALKAPIAEKILFGLPSIEFEYTQLMAKGSVIDIDGDNKTRHVNEAELDIDKLTLEVMGKSLCDLTGLALVDSTPNLIGSITSIKKTYIVNGTIK